MIYYTCNGEDASGRKYIGTARAEYPAVMHFHILQFRKICKEGKLSIIKHEDGKETVVAEDL